MKTYEITEEELGKVEQWICYCTGAAKALLNLDSLMKFLREIKEDK